MSIRTAFLAVSFVIAYFLALTYAILRAGTFSGLEEYSSLVLAAVVFGILAIRDRTRFGTAFLVFFNASRIFFLCDGAAYILNASGIVRIPLNYMNFFGFWALPFGLYAILNFVYTFGFGDQKQKYILFFLGLETLPKS